MSLYLFIIVQNSIIMATTFELASRILGDIWLIKEDFAKKQLPLIVQLIKGKSMNFSGLKSMREELKERTAPLIAVPFAKGSNALVVRNEFNLQDAPKDSMAIIRINGVIQKEDGECSKGLTSYQNELELAGVNPNIKGVLIEMHSPGGSAFGPETLAKMIGNFENEFKKPIAALIANQAASAGYAIISNAPKIFVDGNMSEAGSIGTMITLHNFDKWLEAEGVKEIVVRASDSFNKNQEYYDALNGEIEKLQSEVLDPLNKGFQNLVKKGRKGKINLNKTDENPETGKDVPEVLTGKVYFGKDIIKMGLADEMGSRKDALKYLEKRAKELNSNSNKSTKNNKAMFELLSKSNEELSTQLSALEAQLSDDKSEEISDETRTELQQEKKAVEQIIQLREAEAEALRLSTELETTSTHLTELREASQNAEELTLELNSVREQLEASQKLVEANNKQINDLTSQIETLNQEKEAAEKRAGSFEEFINAKYGAGTSEQVAVSGASTKIDQPEPIKEEKPKTKRQEKLDVVKNSQRIIADMMKKDK